MTANRISGAALLVMLFSAFGTAPPAKGQERASSTMAETSAPLPAQLTSSESGEVAQAKPTPAGQSPSGTTSPTQTDKTAPPHLTARVKLRYGALRAFVIPGA